MMPKEEYDFDETAEDRELVPLHIFICLVCKIKPYDVRGRINSHCALHYVFKTNG